MARTWPALGFFMLFFALPALSPAAEAHGHRPPVAPRIAAGSALHQRTNDPDQDGLPTWFERQRSRTDPQRRDTDGDGLSDGTELRRYRTNPRKADTDGDGFSDREEVTDG